MTEVSVIIPTYNCKEYITDAIESVLSQTFRDYDIIVVDDGSTDGTKDIVTRYGNKIKYARQENKGVSAARNTGIGMASGGLIAFLDADDMWLPDKLEKQVMAFDENPALGLVTCGLIVIDENGSVLRRENEPLAFDRQRLLERIVVRAIVGNTPSCMMVKRECFNKVGNFDEALSGAEDRDLCMRIVRSYDIYMMPECLIKYRVHGKNAHRNAAGMKKNHQEFLKKNLVGSNWLTRRKAFSYLFLDAAREFETDKNQINAICCAFLSFVHFPFKIYSGDDKYQIMIKALIRIVFSRWVANKIVVS